MAASALRMCLLLACLGLSPAGAQTYPSGQVTIIVPVAAGGLTDIIARMASDYISKRTGQTVIVDNRPGGGGTIGLGAMAKAKPDGATLAMAINGDIVINPFLSKTLPFDPMRDFAPIALIAEAPQLLVTTSKLPVSTLPEFIAHAKAHAGEIAYASTGMGSSTHLGAHLFAKLAGLSLNHVPYRGAAPAVTDLVAGHVQMMQLSLGPVAGQLEAGTLKALVVAAPQRWSAVPQVPSSTELGLPDYVGSVWFGLFAPAATPPDVVRTLNGLMRDMLADPVYREKLRGLSLDPAIDTPEAFRAKILREAPVFRQIVAETGATAE